MTPEADYAAEAQCLDYHTIEDFYSERDLVGRGLLNFSRTEDLCRLLDRHAIQAFSACSTEIIPKAGHFFYSLKRLLDALLLRTYPVLQALKKLQPDTVVCFETHHAPTNFWMDFRDESLTALVLPYIAKQTNCHLIQLPAVTAPSPRSPRAPGVKRRIREAITSLPFGDYVLRGLSKLRSRNRNRLEPKYSGKRPSITVLVADGLLLYHDLDESILASGHRLIKLSEILDRLQTLELEAEGCLARADRLMYNKLWSSLSADPGFKRFFALDGVDLFKMVEKRLRHFLCHIMPDTMDLSFRIENHLRESGVSAVLAASPVTADQIACLQAAQRVGIPTAVYQHGAYLHHPINRYTDLILADYFFSFGQEVNRFLVEYQAKPANDGSLPFANPVAIGSVELDQLLAMHRRTSKAQIAPSKTKRKVMYVMSGLMGDLRHFSHSNAEIHYWRLQRDVIETCCGHPDIQLILKPYPSDWAENPIWEHIETRDLTEIQVIRDRKLSDCLAMADLFIVDFLSTTLLQAMTTDKKIIAHVDPDTYPVPESMLEFLCKRALVSTTKTELLTNIAATLQEEDWNLSEPVNDEFLKAYGTHLNDGRSSERLVETLQGIVASWRSSKGSWTDVSRRSASSPSHQ